jgi:hypothetical protein
MPYSTIRLTNNLAANNHTTTQHTTVMVNDWVSDSAGDPLSVTVAVTVMEGVVSKSMFAATYRPLPAKWNLPPPLLFKVYVKADPASTSVALKEPTSVLTAAFCGVKRVGRSHRSGYHRNLERGACGTSLDRAAPSECLLMQ